MSSSSSSSSRAGTPELRSEPEDDVIAPLAEPEEEAPLSHAERRRRKRKAQQEANESDQPTSDKKRKLNDSTAKKTKSKDGSSAPNAADSRIPRQNSVWVGNLAFKTTEDDLKKFFDGIGEITRIHLPTKPGKPNAPVENRGFAYVDFATSDAKTIAITLSENPLNGRKLLIKDGSDFAGRPTGTAALNAEGEAGDRKDAAVSHGISKTGQKILKAQTQPPAPTLFLGNLGFETTEEDIKQLFTAHRRKPNVKEPQAVDGVEGAEKEKKDDWLRKIRMGTFEDSGLCKGFAFLDFSSIQHATDALVNPKNHQLNGRELKVQFASADAVRRGASKTLVTGGDRSAPRDKRKDRKELSDRPPRRPAASTTMKQNTEVDAEPAQEEDGQPEQVKKSKRPHQGEDGHSSFVPRHKGSRGRPKPGAALAEAKRQSAAIVASRTAKQKIVF